MEVRNVLQLPVQETSQVGDARRQVARWTETLGFDETCAGRVSLVVTEMAGNLAKHTNGRGGELLVRALAREMTPGLEVLALDKGPGIANVTRALTDGYSTAGSPGTGLGAISRLADEFAIHSAIGVGTAVLARLWSGPAPRHPPAVQVGVLNLPMPGQDACGDSWAVQLRPDRSVITVVDGLGHGPDAAEASRAAIRSFQASYEETPTRILERMHGALRSTRGAAVAVAVIDTAAGTITYAGVGNISGAIVAGPEMRSLVSHSGTVGHQIHKVQEFTYTWSPDSLLVMHSDGINQRWELDRYPGLASRDPALVAGVIYRDFTRGRDDTTVLVARRSPAP